MSSKASFLLRRQLRRINNHQKVLQRRHRATISASLEDMQPSIATEPVIPDLVRHPKSYKQLPSAKGVPLLGTLPEFLAQGGVENLHKYITKRHQELGGIFRENLAGKDLVYVSDPGIIRNVFANEGQYPKHIIPEAWLLYNQDRKINRGLFFMEDEEWQSNRRILNRLMLRPDAIRPHFASFGEVADCLVHHWTTSYSDNIVPNIEKELYRWAIESLGVMIFGNRLGFLSQSRSSPPKTSYFRTSEMETFISAIHGIFKETCALGTFPPALARTLKLPVWTRFVETCDRALAAGQKLVLYGLESSKERLQRGEEPVSLLDHFIMREQMRQEDVIRLLTDLFLAAADTTSHTAIWSLYLLGRHPQAVEKARQEIQSATEGSGTISGEHLFSMPYLKGVIKEALRLYPVAPFLTRALDKDTLLGGHMVPRGTMVIISAYTTGRNAAHFPNPHQFAPERWLREASDNANDSISTVSDTSSSSSCPFSSSSKSNEARTPSTRLHSHAFIPFGVGSRSCIGRRIAETQLYMLLAKLIANSDFQSVNEVDMTMRMVGVTSEPLQLRINSAKNVKNR
ncbi:hypothetical protein SK128_013556 [Halocaridina rubra]|uniref:Cytochrome P450 n=1 Tax=Halocaridina rubra TaxID=373956 RepID=A0AAN8XB70_HALRR